jgi:hypothetical protein
MDKMLFAFPRLHPDLPAGPGDVPGLLRLDPGVAPDGDRFWRPDGLPLAPSAARGWLAQVQAHAASFRSIGEGISALRGAREDFYTGTAMGIRSELSALARGEQGAGRVLAEAREKAQKVLLLAWILEERLAEIADLGKGLARSRGRLAEVLGIEPEEAMAAAEVAFPEPLGDHESETLPWEALLSAFLCFVPENAVLVISDPVLAEALEERGARLTPGPGMPPDAIEAEVDGETLLGRQAGPDAPWLARRVGLLALSRAAAAAI